MLLFSVVATLAAPLRTHSEEDPTTGQVLLVRTQSLSAGRTAV